MKIEVKLHKQPDDNTCGPAVIKTLADQFNITTAKGELFSFGYIKRLCGCTKDGTELRGFNKALKRLGMKKVRAGMKDITLRRPALWPILALIKDPESNDDHYTLVRGYGNELVYLADPYYGNITMHIGEFRERIRFFNGRPWLWEII
jgi:predicted double-glycine peptidase